MTYLKFPRFWKKEEKYEILIIKVFWVLCIKSIGENRKKEEERKQEERRREKKIRNQLLEALGCGRRPKLVGGPRPASLKFEHFEITLNLII